MTLSALLHQVHVATGWPVPDIQRLVRDAWPDHQQFSETQAALVEHSIRRRNVAVADAEYTIFEEVKRSARPLSHDQLWGEER